MEWAHAHSIAFEIEPELDVHFLVFLLGLRFLFLLRARGLSLRFAQALGLGGAKCW